MDNSNVFRLVIQKGPQVDKEFALVKDIISLGRDASNDFPIPDPEVSRRHARLIKQGNDYFIEDLGSTNGTFINRARVSAPYKLVPGDEVGFGETVRLVYQAPYEDVPRTMVSEEEPEPEFDATMAADAGPHPYVAAPSWEPEPYKAPPQYEPEYEPPPPPKVKPTYAPPPPPPIERQPTYAPPPPPQYEPLPPVDPPSFRPPAAAPEYPAEEGKKKKSRKGLFIGCGCLLLLIIVALVVGLGYLLYNAPVEFWNDPINNIDRLLGMAAPFLAAL